MGVRSPRRLFQLLDFSSFCQMLGHGLFIFELSATCAWCTYSIWFTMRSVISTLHRGESVHLEGHLHYHRQKPSEQIEPQEAGTAAQFPRLSHGNVVYTLWNCYEHEVRVQKALRGLHTCALHSSAGLGSGSCRLSHPHPPCAPVAGRLLSPAKSMGLSPCGSFFFYS